MTTIAASFVGTLATRILLAPARDPEFKGIVERANGFLETSFLGRVFTDPGDFNAQLQQWLPRANTRRVRSTQARPVDLLDTDRQGMPPLPRTAPAVGLRLRTRLARDYHLRVDGNDYSADPRHIGRHVDIIAGLDRVTITSSGTVIAEHARSWGKHPVITDPDHQAAATRLRAAFTAKTTSSRRHADGHLVAIRALSDYDECSASTSTPHPSPPSPKPPSSSRVRSFRTLYPILIKHKGA